MNAAADSSAVTNLRAFLDFAARLTPKLDADDPRSWTDATGVDLHHLFTARRHWLEAVTSAARAILDDPRSDERRADTYAAIRAAEAAIDETRAICMDLVQRTVSCAVPGLVEQSERYIRMSDTLTVLVEDAGFTRTLGVLMRAFTTCSHALRDVCEGQPATAAAALRASDFYGQQWRDAQTKPEPQDGRSTSRLRAPQTLRMTLSPSAE